MIIILLSQNNLENISHNRNTIWTIGWQCFQDVWLFMEC